VEPQRRRRPPRDHRRGVCVTVAPELLEKALSDLDAGALEHLGHLLLERAERRRQRLSVDEARAAVAGAELSGWWRRSVLIDVGRVRRASTELVLAGWAPEQIVDALVEVGLTDCFPDGPTIAAAIAHGIADARRLQR
jgi:hypothetical protein